MTESSGARDAAARDAAAGDAGVGDEGTGDAAARDAAARDARRLTGVGEEGTGDARRLKIRRLVYPDLPQVMAIERRVFPTPWSLAMFVMERSKQSGICLAAVLDTQHGGRRLAGYLICSRYERVWHVMNVAVDTDHQRSGVASALLAELYVQVEDEDARFTLEVRRSNHPAIHLYEREGFRAAGVRRRYYQDNGEDALVMWRTPATLRGSLDDVPNPGPV